MPHDSIRARVAMTIFGPLGELALVGKRIKSVGWVHPEDLGTAHYAAIIILEDDTQIVALSDDEGNDAGALAIAPGDQKQPAFTLPRI